MFFDQKCPRMFSFEVVFFVFFQTPISFGLLSHLSPKRAKMSMRKLKYHEQKLLKKVDFLWQKENDVKEMTVIKRYHLKGREEYVKYNRMVGKVTKLVSMLKALPQDEPFRIQRTQALIQKLYENGWIKDSNSLSDCMKVSVSSIARRRLPVVLVRLRFAESLRVAMSYVQHGHIRVGPEVISDPAFLVSRTMEDFITWVDQSKIVRHIRKYNDELDDFDLL